MPSNFDIEQQSADAANSDVATQTSVANETSAALDMPDCPTPQEFKFFQKKKRSDGVPQTPALSYASYAQMTAFIARLDTAIAVNNKTQRHIADLDALMADVARTMRQEVRRPSRKTLRRSKWLFYLCLTVFGAGWFFLSPSGHTVLTQLLAFVVR